MRKLFKRFLLFLLVFTVLISSVSIGITAHAAETGLETFAQQLVQVVREYNRPEGYTEDVVFETQTGAVQAQEFARSLEAEINVEADTVVLNKNGAQAVLRNGSREIAVSENGEEQTVIAAQPAVITGQEAEVPVAETAQALGFEVQRFDAALRVSRPFQTCRLIVKTAKRNIDTRGAVKSISGYNDLVILQYETEQQTYLAYSYFQTLAGIQYVEPDYMRVMQSAPDTQSAEDFGTQQGKKDVGIKGSDFFYSVRENALSWVSQEIGFEEIKNTLAQKLLPQMTVAVLDSGVDTDHSFLKDRLLANTLNLSTTGNENSVEDDYGHGTHVAGIVADNTLANVRIKPYKVLNNEGKGVSSLIAVAVDQAVADGASVINMSLSGEGESELLTEAVQSAVRAGVNVVAAAGNNSKDLDEKYYAPACIEEAFTVSSVGKSGVLSYFSNYGEAVDIAAYGENIKSCYLNDTYTLMSGTSMAAPLVSAALAVVRSYFPNLSAEAAEARIEKYAIKKYTDSKNYFGSGLLYLRYILQELPRVADPVFGTTQEEFSAPFNLTLTCPEADSKIYYVLNATDDLPEIGVIRGTQYTKSIPITTDTKVTAIAVSSGKLPSKIVSYNFKRVVTTEDSKYDISSNGTITAFYGRDTDLTVPDTIRGIRVQAIGASAFKENTNLETVVLPDAVREIGIAAFSGCTSLYSVYGKNLEKLYSNAFQNSAIEHINWENITYVGSFAFSGCANIKEIDLSSVTVVETSAFENTGKIESVRSSVLTSIGSYAFRNSGVQEVYAPMLTSIGVSGFENCTALVTAEIPAVKYLFSGAFKNCLMLKKLWLPDVISIGSEAFGNTALRWASYEKATTVGSKAFAECAYLRGVELPNATTVGAYAFENCKNLKRVELPALKVVEAGLFDGCTRLFTLALPKVTSVKKNGFLNAALREITFGALTDLNSLPETAEKILVPSALKRYSVQEEQQSLAVYASRGSVGERLADALGAQFRELPFFENALPEEVDPQNPALIAEVTGMDLTYQWYKNDVASCETGTAIEGATQAQFVPTIEENAAYYYCVVTNRDGAIVTEKTSSLVRNSPALQKADYTAYENAVAQASALNKDNYIDFSAVEAALAVDVSGKNITEQGVVDAQTAAILQAVGELQYKGADYTAYENAVAQASALNKDNYIDFSAVEAALAVDVSGKNITEQGVVDAQTAAILQAVGELQYKGADYSAYENAVAQASALNKDNYIDFSAVEATLAVDVSGKNITEQGVVDAQTAAILQAVGELQYKGADYTAYENAVAQASALNKDNYIDFSAVEATLAVDVSGKNITEQGVVDAQTAAIVQAISALQYKGADYTAYNSAVTQASALNKDEYIDFSAVEAALAMDVSGKNITEQGVVDAQTAAIVQAISALQYKGADYTAYNSAVAQASALNKDNYIDFSAVEAALAVDVSGKNITEQGVVDAQTAAIVQAISALQYKGADYSAYNSAVAQASALNKDNYIDFSAVEAALAVDVSGKNITEQGVVDAQTAAIVQAISALQYKGADYSVLGQTLQTLPLDLSLFTEDSAQSVIALLETISYGEDITKQAEINRLNEALVYAISQLQYKPADYTQLERVLQNVPMDLSGYTKESAASLQTLLDRVPHNADVTQQEELDRLCAEIGLAAEALEKRQEPAEKEESVRVKTPGSQSGEKQETPEIPKTGEAAGNGAVVLLLALLVFARRKERDC